MLDTGSSLSIMGNVGIAHCKEHKIRVRPVQTELQLAHGRCKAEGAVRLTIKWAGGTRTQRFLLVKNLTPEVLLGRDFLAGTEVNVNIKEGGWTQGSIAQRVVPFDVPPPPAPAEVLGVTEQTCEVNFPRKFPEQVTTAIRHANIFDNEKQELEKTLWPFANMFTKVPGHTTLEAHRINTGDARPIRCQPRPVSAQKRAIIDEAFNELLDLGLIEPSYSAWAAPIVMVPKKDGTHRMCIDYRKLNDVTVPDSYPMPSIPDIMAYLGRAKFFTILDLSKGYFQVDVVEEDRDKTSFVCHRGSYRFRVLPMGLRNSPSTFQRLIDRILRDCKWRCVMGFIDDLVVFSETFQEHLQHLTEVLTRLQQAGLTLNPDKIQLCVAELSLLGYRLSPGICQPDPSKVEAIEHFPAPRNVKELQRYLGMVGYYRSFIPNFAETAQSLHQEGPTVEMVSRAARGKRNTVEAVGRPSVPGFAGF